MRDAQLGAFHQSVTRNADAAGVPTDERHKRHR
jgi:hypothetical protein